MGCNDLFNCFASNVGILGVLFFRHVFAVLQTSVHQAVFGINLSVVTNINAGRFIQEFTIYGKVYEWVALISKLITSGM